MIRHSFFRLFPYSLSSILLFALFALAFSAPAFSQQTWMRTFGGSGNDIAYSVQQTSDRGYIVAGVYNQNGTDPQVYLIKTDSSGAILWTKTYGGMDVEVGNCVQQTSDGGYIVAGFTTSFGAGGQDVYLIKTNASGDTLWTRTYGGPNNDYANSVQQTLDGGYVIAGTTLSFGAWGDVYLIRTNASGDTLWTKTYGGSSLDLGNSARQTTGGGYIIAGYTASFGVGGDVYLIKTDASGDTLWTKTYGGSSIDYGNSVRQTMDGGYIIAGYTYSFGQGLGDDAYLIKTDASGDTLWTRISGGTYNDFGNSVQLTSDGGYIIAGGTNSLGAGDYDIFLIKANSSGSALWTRTYGGTNDDRGYSVQQTADDGFIIAGYTSSFGEGGDDVCLIKTDANGNVGVEDHSPSRLKPYASRLTVSPNPFTSFATVSGHSSDRFNLYDISGRYVGTYKGDRIGEGLSAGVYFLKPEGKDTKPLRIVKLR